MNKIFKYFIYIILYFTLIQNLSSATNYCYIDYTVPIDYSKIDKNELANQANLFFQHFEQITDTEYRKRYIQPLLNRYSVLSNMAPKDPFNFTRLGILYDELGNDIYAKSNFFKATNLVPGYQYASYAFGNYYYKRGYYRKALKKYKEAEGITPPYNYDRFMKVGSIYEKLGNYSLSIESYKEAYKLQEGVELYNKILLLEDLNTKNMLYH